MHTWIGGETLSDFAAGIIEHFFLRVDIFLALENESSVDATRARARDDGCLRRFAK